MATWRHGEWRKTGSINIAQLVQRLRAGMPGSRGSPSSRPSPPPRHPPPPPPLPPYSSNGEHDMRYGHGHGHRDRRGPSRSPYERPSSRPQAPSTTVLGWTPRAPGSRRDRDLRGDGPPPPPISSSADRHSNGIMNGTRDPLPPPPPRHAMSSPPSRRPPPPARSPIMRPLPRAHSPSNITPAPNTPTPTGGNGNVAAHTPSWLTGRYRSTSAAVPSSSPPAVTMSMSMHVPAPGSIEAFCKDRLDTICAVVDSTSTTDAIPELRKVMENLEYSKIDIENDIANKARQERIRAYRRIEKSRRELRKAERHLMNVDLQAQHIESKIRRLSEYSAFIENKWRDEHANEGDTTNNNMNMNKNGSSTSTASAPS